MGFPVLIYYEIGEDSIKETKRSFYKNSESFFYPVCKEIPISTITAQNSDFVVLSSNNYSSPWVLDNYFPEGSTLKNGRHNNGIMWAGTREEDTHNLIVTAGAQDQEIHVIKLTKASQLWQVITFDKPIECICMNNESLAVYTNKTIQRYAYKKNDEVPYSLTETHSLSDAPVAMRLAKDNSLLLVQKKAL